MAHLSDHFADEAEATAVLEAAAERLGRAIGVTRAFYGEIDVASETIDLVMDWTDGVPSTRGRYPFLLHSPSVQTMIRTGATVVEDIDTIDIPEVQRQVQLASHTLAWIAVPLMRGGEPVALVGVSNAVPRTFTQADVDLVREVGEQTWQALVHAHTRRMLREHQQAMDARAGHERFFRALGDATRDDRDDATVLFKIATMLADHLSADIVSFSEPDADDLAIHHVRRHHARPVARRTTHRIVMPPSATGFLERMADGEPLAIGDARGEMDAAIAPFLRQWDIGAFLSAPVVEGGRIVLILTVQTGEPHRWAESDVRLVHDLAERAWTAVSRRRAAAALAERERHQRLLIAWNDAVREADDADAIVTATLERLDAAFGDLTVSFGEVECDAEPRVRMLADSGLTADPAGEALVALAAGADSGSVAVASGALPLGAALVAPVRVQGRLAALLSLRSDRERSWTTGERQLLRDLADRAWATLERMRAEAALARSREALGQAEKMASLGAVLAGISHELYNPLAVVTAQAELIAHIAEGTELAERARRVHEAGDRCARIIQTFLAMARQAPSERRPAAVAALLFRAVDQVADALDAADIVVTVTCDPRLHVAVDADQIHQILVNLLVNAEHALTGAGGGDRTIRVVADGTADGRVAIDVNDTGPGVPDAARRRIFEPFYTSKPAGRGTGMGLALAQGLAELHGGSLTLEPSATGAHFRLTLPLG